jgi:hypothetical protein
MTLISGLETGREIGKNAQVALSAALRSQMAAISPKANANPGACSALASDTTAANTEGEREGDLTVQSGRAGVP